MILLHIPSPGGESPLPGAQYFDTNRVERPPLWNCLPLAELHPILLANGITPDTPVAVYGQDKTAAARVAFILLYAGVREVRLLDAAPSGEARAPEGHAPLGTPFVPRPEIYATAADVRHALNDPNALVVCTRSWAEFTGQTSGYDYFDRRGRIAGSVWGGAESMGFFRRPLWEVAADWRARGITPDKRTIFYCGTGWRASEAWWAARALGWQNIAVYDGGWLEWSADAANPVETGTPPSHTIPAP
jgi:thiosulfate/3-mercaptopyruvate sulfurtransferase